MITPDTNTSQQPDPSLVFEDEFYELMNYTDVLGGNDMEGQDNLRVFMREWIFALK
jgi:hypothetical protein